MELKMDLRGPLMRSRRHLLQHQRLQTTTLYRDFSCRVVKPWYKVGFWSVRVTVMTISSVAPTKTPFLTPEGILLNLRMVSRQNLLSTPSTRACMLIVTLTGTSMSCLTRLLSSGAAQLRFVCWPEIIYGWWKVFYAPDHRWMAPVYSVEGWFHLVG